MARTVLLALLGVLACTHAFYLPGVAPKEYKKGSRVELKVNKLTSVHTALPYDYYELPVCKPAHVRNTAENLGEVLSGDTISNSLFELAMQESTTCNILCEIDYTDEQATLLQQLIDEEYRVNWIIDNLPAAVRHGSEEDGSDVRYAVGFPLGHAVKPTEDGPTLHYLYNHVRLRILYHDSADGSYKGSRVVGFEVEPFSVAHELDAENNKQLPAATAPKEGEDASKMLAEGLTRPTALKTCNSNRLVDASMQHQRVDKASKVVWTYDVEWVPSAVRWAARWDVFLKQNGNEKIHWFSIINSLMIVVFLSGMVAMIMVRILHRDFDRYNAEKTPEEVQEETGWKMVHADVFRAPVFSPLLLSVAVGSGVQVLLMTVVTIVFAALGFLSPANRGGLMTAVLLLFVFMGCFAGFVSARLYKMMEGKSWKQCMVVTALGYPGIVGVIFIVLNIVVHAEDSSLAVPFGTLFALLLLWIGISVPLVFAGGFVGFRRERIKPPVHTNVLPRALGAQPWYMQPVFATMVGGILPFGAVFIELFFIMSSLWRDQVYYVFGFLSLVLLILLVTCAEITIVMTYFQLCGEDYNWWWRAFLTPGSSAVYLFLYSIYFYTQLDVTRFASTVLYFGYMGVISVTFFLLTGSVGFLATLWFVRTIYASVKLA